jgi:hypothetical protein
MNTYDDVSDMIRVQYLQVEPSHSQRQCDQTNEVMTQFAFLCLRGVVKTKCALECD